MDHPLNFSPFYTGGVFRVNRWLVLSVAMAGLLLAVAVRSSIRATARRKRETGYSKTLQAYAQALHPGMTRKQVEDYLRSKNTRFNWVFGGFSSATGSQFADLVKIGEEAAPRYCSEEYVYVAFEFEAVENDHQSESDVLERIEIHRPDSGCL